MKKEIIHGVYLIRNTDNGKVYVGSSSNIETRLRTHFSNLKNNKHVNKGLQEDYNKGMTLLTEIYRTYPINDQKIIFAEEKRTIEEFMQNGISLYNINKLTGWEFVPKEILRQYMVDEFCREHFGRTFEALMVNSVPAQLSQIYETLQNPEKKEEIEDKYRDIITYQQRERFFHIHYGCNDVDAHQII